MQFMITRRIKRPVGKTYMYSELIMGSDGRFSSNPQDVAVFNSMADAQFVANGFELEPNIEYMVSPWRPEE